jgi:hypothetical protein
VVPLGERADRREVGVEVGQPERELWHSWQWLRGLRFMAR